LIVSAKELLKTLEIKAPVLSKSKQDIGSEGKALKNEAYYYNNAYNLAITKKENCTLICPDDSSFNSFLDTKKELNENDELKEKISIKLENDGLELSVDTKVLHVNNLINLSKLKSMIIKPFDNFNVAIFYSNKNEPNSLSKDILSTLGAKIINFDTAYDSNGYEILTASCELADKLAGKIMLDIFDNGADFVLTDDSRSIAMFDTRQKKLETSVGRDIQLPVLSTSQVVLMALGCEDRAKIGLDLHKVKTKII
jgi:succinate dehydrogenase / fumarate reductase cytochrome b subunit